jgi:hypothetical protein
MNKKKASTSRLPHKLGGVCGLLADSQNIQGLNYRSSHIAPEPACEDIQHRHPASATRYISRIPQLPSAGKQQHEQNDEVPKMKKYRAPAIN